MSTATKTETTPATETEAEPTCQHRWLLGQPVNGAISARCRKCGADRVYPAVLDDLDPGIETEPRHDVHGVATAVGGARPSSVALIGNGIRDT
jgi:hypothetical protein